ncbi:MAG: hypothetical protein HQK58_04720 [Deltaproteobacteria bacterium]|nr:hypothetical protein [Deltaproteobacteria bacterium]
MANFEEYVKRNEIQSKWKISDEHLCLSRGILPEDGADKKWKTIPALWENVVTNFVEVIKANKAEKWFDELAKLCKKQFIEDFRGMGVRRFYQVKSTAREDMVKVIVAGIQSELFDQWKNSELSLHEVSLLMTSLIADTEDRLGQIDGKIARARDKEDNCKVQISKKRQDFDRCGLVGKMVGKKWDLFHAQVELMQQKYVIMTLIEGFLFAKSLLLNLIDEFNRLNREIANCAALLTEAVARCDFGMKERCKGSFEADIHGHLVKFHDYERVSKFAARLVKQQSAQKSQTNKIRSVLVAKLGNEPSFALFSERIHISFLMKTLEMICGVDVMKAHDTLIDRQEDRLFGMSIIEKLKQRFESDPSGLRDYIEKLLCYTGVNLTFDKDEMGEKATNGSGKEILSSAFTILIPRSQTSLGFVAQLKTAFSESVEAEVEIIETDHKINEIDLINVKSAFPLRFVKQVRLLKEEYLRRITGSDAENSRFLLHLEGNGSQHPPLYATTSDEKVNETIPYLLMARALKLILSMPDRQTGISKLVWPRKNKWGMDDVPIILGETLIETPAVMTMEHIHELKTSVLDRIAHDFPKLDEKEQLLHEIRKVLLAVKNEVQGDVFDPQYQKFIEGSKSAIKNILRLS